MIHVQKLYPVYTFPVRVVKWYSRSVSNNVYQTDMTRVRSSG